MASTQLYALVAEIAYLKDALEHAERKLAAAKAQLPTDNPKSNDYSLPMPLEDYKRYGRQMILEDFGLPAQLKLRSARVVVVGAGGLGCPALQYLAAAGVGTIGIVDPDEVDLSNLHRQILHMEARIGWPKALSAKAALEAINPAISISTYITALSPSNALPILASYDVVLDCSDNPPTRYLLSDACVALGKSLVSGAAIRYDGQLCVYNLPLSPPSPSPSPPSPPASTASGPVEQPPRGPCYRCLWPTPPRPEEIGTCEEIGVLGSVTGLIGVLQAQETLKLLIGATSSPDAQPPEPRLLTFSALAQPMFRSLKLRGRRADCVACGPAAVAARGQGGLVESTDYVAFCGARAELEAGEGNGERISAKELHELLEPSEPPIANQVDKPDKLDIIDVRAPAEFSICHLPHSRNVPLPTLLRDLQAYLPPHPPDPDVGSGRETYVVCKRGNDSQVAAAALRSAMGGAGAGAGAEPRGTQVQVRDVVGGLAAWSRDVDPGFPVY